MASATHEVLNQPPIFSDFDLFTRGQALVDAVVALSGDKDLAALAAFGREWGSAERLDEARLANAFPPVLKTFDSRGFRIDKVEFHPAYHALMEASTRAGLHMSCFEVTKPDDLKPSGFVTRASRVYITGGVEAGHGCPITMTHAAIPALAAAPAHLKALWPRLVTRGYDRRAIPFWEKKAVTIGMGMTEKQGGSDVRANTTRAELISGEEYRITGHKWFFSAPMCDLFLVLAQAEGGLTCFLMPRHEPDGTPNGLHLQRLKDKVGNRSNASSEVEFDKAFAWRIGEEGRGVRTIIEMVQFTRLDCALASAGIMRMALALAMHHTRHRTAFQKKLVDQPAMRMLLADLALEQEAHTALAMSLAAAFERASEDPVEAAYARLFTPVAKFHICKAAPGFVYEALECLGGNGYVEESIAGRLYREAPLNAIWEGSGNVIALDVLRAIGRNPTTAMDWLAQVGRTIEGLPGTREMITGLQADLRNGGAEFQARRIAEKLAMLAATAALVRIAPPIVAEAYALTRLAAPRRIYGANDVGKSADLLLDRAWAA